MGDIIKSGVLAIAFIATIMVAAPMLNESDDKKLEDSEKIEKSLSKIDNKVGLKNEKNIHTPL